MFHLYKLKKIVSVSQCGGGADPTIKLSAYLETNTQNILVLFCNNGYLLFYTTTANSKPLVRQVEWYHHVEKQVEALCFDSYGAWLLLVSSNSTLFMLPLMSFLDPSANLLPNWKCDDITEIKLLGQRGKPTSLQWWQTLHGLHIAIIGTEFGEISFINLTSRKEVGGTSIPVGISCLDLLHDDNHDTTYLLITSTCKQQWRLLLEQKKTGIFWPLDGDYERINHEEKESLNEKEKSPRSRPHHLSKFESGTFLTPQQGHGRNLVSAYNSTSNILQVLEGDLDQMQLFSYHISPDCENIILTDKLIFITVSNATLNTKMSTLILLSRKFLEMSGDSGKKPKEVMESEVQHFNIIGEILAVYKRSSQKISFENKCELSDLDVKLIPKEMGYPGGLRRHIAKTFQSYCAVKADSDSCTNQDLSNVVRIDDPLSKEFTLDGCLIVQKTAVWECCLRNSPEMLFLSLSSDPSNLPDAEKLGVMLGLDISRLYEVAADLHLSSGQFAQAVHLYQLSKCPQLKRVAHFMGYGYLSELIAYIQVLFSTKSVDIAPPDKGHFANIALHCFTQQVMEKRLERPAIVQAFRKFLKENLYYDNEVAVRLLAEQGLYDLLYHCAEMRGEQNLMIDILLSTDGIREAVDFVHDSFVNGGYERVLLHAENESYLKCVTSSQLLPFLLIQPRLLFCHLQHVIQLLPKMNEDYLCKLAALYDPSNGAFKLMMRNNVNRHHHRYWSSSLTSLISTDLKDILHSDEESTNEEDVLKFFIFILLMLGHKRGRRKFDLNLMKFKVINNFDTLSEDCNACITKLKSPQPLSCGVAHAGFAKDGILYTWGKSGNGRLGQGDSNTEYLVPASVGLLFNLQVRVSSVSCGALHTLAITNCGIFGWGSSRYGQLGAGDLQRSHQPLLLEHLSRLPVYTIECGQYHTLALSEDGRVYSFGWGVHGQLGHKTSDDLCFPKLIEFFSNKQVLGICAGHGHSAVLTDEGHVYTFGCGMFGQLGLGTVHKHSCPHHVDLPCRIKLLSSGYFHLVAVSENNKIYTWGCNPQALRLQAQSSRRARLQVSSNQGQDINGHSSQSAKRLSNQQVNTSPQSHLLPNLVDTSTVLSQITQLSCGSHHSALITEDGEVYMWGRNMEGQLGNGTCKEQKTPCMVLPLNDRRIISIACGADFTIACDSDGKLWGWGQNDNGQVGHKPVSESSTKSSGASSSGRVITIRTNRRMITITQPCRQCITRPVEVSISTSADVITSDLESSSFESDYYMHTLIYQKLNKCKECPILPQLSSLDCPAYGPYALHVTLKAFHHFCDSVALLSHCHSFNDFQAAAKLCALQNMYSKALKYQLQALNMYESGCSLGFISITLEVLNFYAKMADEDNIEANKEFLENAITYWMEKSLQVAPLENFLLKHLALFSYPLGLILFCCDIARESSSIYQNFLASLSTVFCFQLTQSIIEYVQQDKNHVTLTDIMMGITGTASFLHQIHTTDGITGWDDSVPPHRLWHEIFRHLQKGSLVHSTVHLSANDVDVFTKSIMNERPQEKKRFFSDKECQKLNNENIILFSCGHNYTSSTFRTTLLPNFQDFLQKLPYSVSRITQLLLIQYEIKDIFSVACPKCVMTELKSEL